ncbi:MAG: helix-turn-helix domain-containing protein [Sulfitobacter litoralis]|uniref:helix-turn-helix domain-containing protein n=1 Tax=Sulfitobacter litoralis TaxID=335975 RepID=UPI0030015A7F
MSIRVMSRIWDEGPRKQGPLLVMLALADYSSDAGECWPSIKAIAEKARMTERGVQRIIRQLEDEGWLTVDTGNGRRGCNHYVINPDRRYTPDQGSPRPSIPETPTVDPETPTVGTPEPSLTVIEPSFKKPRAAPSKKTRMPQDAVLTDRMIEIAEEEGHTPEEAAAQFKIFKNGAIANGRAYVDWSAAWRNWFNSQYFKAITGGQHGSRNSNQEQRDNALADEIFAASRAR